MMSIGEFAALTGLTVRALRHYDEEGILAPAEVDPGSRYRRYSAEQLPVAMKLAALRRADLPLADVDHILTREAEISDVIVAHRARLREELARQEGKLAELELLASLETEMATGSVGAPLIVEERPVIPCDWAGVEMIFDEDFMARGQEMADQFAATGRLPDRGEDPAVTVPRALTAAGCPPEGRSWLTLELGDGDTPARMVMCWQVPRPVPDDWTVPGERTVTGRTAAGRELVARGGYESLSVWEQVGQSTGVVAVLREAERRGLEVDLRSLRLFHPEPRPAPDQDVTEFEIAIPLATPNGQRRT